MKKVIISGATGFLGSAFVKFLIDQNISVLALGRKKNEDIDFPEKYKESDYFTYMKIAMEEIQKLPKKIEEIKWEVGDSCIFYHFAWQGKNRLTDGDIGDQMKNVNYAASAVIAAKQTGCKTFINLGSQEEIFLERYLETNLWRKEKYHSDMGVYATAKLASKDMCKLLSYLHKIDYIHIRFSAILDKEKPYSGYISSVFQKILRKEDFARPQNSQLFDLILINDALKAFFEVGRKGRNKDEFFIGTGEPKTLEQYFSEFSSLIESDGLELNSKNTEFDQILAKKDFSVDYLYQQTGFKPSSDIYINLLK